MYLCKNISISMSYVGVQDPFQIQMRSMKEFIENDTRSSTEGNYHREIKTKRLSIYAGCLF